MSVITRLHPSYILDMPFNENTGNPTNRGTATLTSFAGVAPTWVDGPVGKAGSYSGGNQSIVTNWTRGTGAFSLYMLVTPVWIAGGGNFGLIGSGWATSRMLGLVSLNSANDWTWIPYLWDSATVALGVGLNISRYAPTLIGMSWDPVTKTMAAFADGRYSSSVHTGVGTFNDTFVFKLLNDSAGVMGYFKGTISHVNLVNSVITENQFNVLYRSYLGSLL